MRVGAEIEGEREREREREGDGGGEGERGRESKSYPFSSNRMETKQIICKSGARQTCDEDVI